LEKIIRPIVEGQIRSFLHDHPEVLIGVKRNVHVGKDQASWVMNSLSKRITRDLTCGTTTARLVAAALSLSHEAAAESCCGITVCSNGVRGGISSAPDATGGKL
jgi:hypothetical protein